MDIDGIVHPVTVQVISSAIAMAEREHAAALLIRLSTPGSFADATRNIVEQIFHSPVPVIVWTVKDLTEAEVNDIDHRAQQKVDAATEEARNGAPARVDEIERQVWSDGGAAWRN